MSWDKLSDAAAECAIWALIADVAAERKDAARAWLAEHMGADAAAVKAVANGTVIGKATLVEGKPKPVIVDQRAFLAFIREHYPTELLEVVNPAFQKLLLSKSTAVDGILVDSNGVPVAGVEVRASTPYVSVRKTDEAKEIVEALLNGGRLSLDGITQPELEAGA